VPEENRFCGECGARVEEASSADTLTDVPGEAPSRSVTQTPSTSDTFDGSRFLPGAMLAGRYRIVGLLGRGGMGEIYRADDLKLGQPVALKLLPQELETNLSRLERFLNEVKIARQVSHPNVCRVYDVGEVDGQHFLSMEYVDGEDLASLLRRIGRLPGDKAVEIARQLCAGLAAAHARGIVHRDLKPGNIMIDGQGKVRITDFGLAGLAKEIEGPEIRAGTPAYMAPEQLDGKEVTPKSDIFSLGVVLYELFTGKSPYDAPTLAGVAKLRQKPSPASPSTLVPDLDQAVERIILRCMERDPAMRPSTALAVAAALPGGDPLAAALAAGETPSPEMVAAAGPEGGLKAGAALACLAAVFVGLLVAAAFLGKNTLYGTVPMERPNAALVDDAREIISDLGYTEPPGDSAHSLVVSNSTLQYLMERDSSASRWEPLSRSGEIAIHFWYRQSPELLSPRNLTGRVGSEDPYPDDGDITLSIDLEGRLILFRAVTPYTGLPDAPAAPEDQWWRKLFAAARLDPDDFEEIEPSIKPPVYADEHRAWQGVLPHRGDLPVRVEAAASGGRPAFFDTVTPADPYWSEETAASRETPQAISWVQTSYLILLVLIALAAVLLAMHNWRGGRGDRRGSVRLAISVLTLSLLYWAVTGHHVSDLGEESVLMVVALGNALTLGLLSWVLYMALEPYARRLWPEALVSWSRLLAGRFTDPLVGRDLLIGFIFGTGFVILNVLTRVLPKWMGLPPSAPIAWGMQALNGGRLAFGQIFIIPLISLSVPLGHFMMFLLLRIILRKQWLAAIAYCAILSLSMAVTLGVQAGEVSQGLFFFGAGIGALIAVIVLTILVRFGLLAAAGCFLIANHIPRFPVTLDTAAPYFGASMFGLLVAAAITIAAFYVSLAGRPMLGESLLRD
jgi:serine/threonine-protein kinase